MLPRQFCNIYFEPALPGRPTAAVLEPLMPDPLPRLALPATVEAAAAELARRRCSCKHAGAGACAQERKLRSTTACMCRCHLLRSIVGA